MLNKVIIMGRLTRDPEIKKVNNDISVCSFSIACDRDIVNKQNNERETDFFDVTAWRSTADFVGKQRRFFAACACADSSTRDASKSSCLDSSCAA